NARIVFRAEQAGIFRIHATSFRNRTVGSFTLMVRENEAANAAIRLAKALKTADQEIAAGRTQQAVGHLVIASAGNPKDTGLALKVGALQAWFGLDKELDDTCRRALEFARDTKDLFTLERTAKLCSLRASQDKARLKAMLVHGRKAVDLGKDNPYVG